MSTPLYRRIATLIRDDFVNGHEPGTPLPSERMMTDRYGAARETIRKALGVLEDEGSVRNRDGERTVRGRRRWRLQMDMWERMHGNGVDAWQAAMLEQGAKTAESVIDVLHIGCPVDVADALGIAAGTEVVTRRRLHIIDGEPEQMSQSFYPPAVTDGHPEFTRPGDVKAPGGLLAHSGHKQTRYRDVHAPRPPTVEEQAKLRTGSGETLHVVSRTGYDADETPVRFFRLLAPTERTILQYDLAAE